MAYFDDLDLGAAFKALQPPEPKKPNAFRSAGDTGLSLARGAVQGVKMLSDATGAGNPVSDTLQQGVDWLSNNFSDYSKWEQLTSAQDMRAAALSGSTWEEVKAAARAFGARPVDFLAEAAGTSIPTIAAAFLPGGQGAILGRVAMMGMGAAQGAGAVKGQIYQTVEQAWKQAGATPEEAAERASAAQDYFGTNAGQVALGTALGALAGGTGVESAILGKTAAAGAAPAVGLMERAAAKAPRFAREGLKESLPEAAQGGQEQLAGNLAMQNEGFDTPTMQGVAGNAVLEGAAGGLFGAAVSPFTGQPAQQTDTRTRPARAEDVQRTAAPSEAELIGKIAQATDINEVLAAATELAKPPSLMERAQGIGPEQSPVAAELAQRRIDRQAAAAGIAQPALDPLVRAEMARERGAQAIDALRGPDPAPVQPKPLATPVPVGTPRQRTAPAIDLTERIAEAESFLKRGDVRLALRKRYGQNGASDALRDLETLKTEGDRMLPARTREDLLTALQARLRAATMSPAGVKPRTGSVEGQPLDPAVPNAVRQYVDRMRATNTPAAKAFVRDFDAGRIKPEDVADIVGRFPASDAQIVQTRIEQAAAQAPAVQPDPIKERVERMRQQPAPQPIILMTGDGKPYGTKASAQARATKEGGEIKEVEGGWVVEKAGSQAEPNPEMVALRQKWKGLADKPDAIVRATEEWDKAKQDLTQAMQPGGYERGNQIGDEVAEEWGQQRIAADQLAYLAELTKRLRAEVDRVRAEQDTPGTFSNKLRDKRDREASEQSAAAMQKAIAQDIEGNLARIREMQRQGRLSLEDARTLLRLAEEAADSLDAARKLEDFIAAKSIQASEFMVGRDEKAANDEPSEKAPDQPSEASPSGQPVPEPSRAEDDYLKSLFGNPSDPFAELEKTQQEGAKQEAAARADLTRVREAIAREQQRAKAEADDWASRTYKANKNQVDLRGDGPSNQASMSIGAINESRRRNALEALKQEVAALEKLAQALSTDAGADKVMANLRALMDKARAAVASGNWPGYTVDSMFESMLLDDLKFRGPGGKGNVTSNGLSKAVLQALKGAEPAPLKDRVDSKRKKAEPQADDGRDVPRGAAESRQAPPVAAEPREVPRSPAELDKEPPRVNQPDVDRASAEPAGDGDGRGADADRGERTVRRVADDAGRREPDAPEAPEQRGRAGQPLDDGGQPYEALTGKTVKVPVRVEETGETATLEMDGAKTLADFDQRIGVLKQLVECLT